MSVKLTIAVVIVKLATVTVINVTNVSSKYQSCNIIVINVADYRHFECNIIIT